MLLFGLALVLVMLFRPAGSGRPLTRKRELRREAGRASLRMTRQRKLRVSRLPKRQVGKRFGGLEALPKCRCRLIRARSTA